MTQEKSQSRPVTEMFWKIMTHFKLLTLKTSFLLSYKIFDQQLLYQIYIKS